MYHLQQMFPVWCTTHKCIIV